jgi:hypothetical protein
MPHGCGLAQPGAAELIVKVVAVTQHGQTFAVEAPLSLRSCPGAALPMAVYLDAPRSTLPAGLPDGVN